MQTRSLLPVWKRQLTHFEELYKPSSSNFCCYSSQTRHSNDDGRARLSHFWVPTGGFARASARKDAHSLLIQAGLLRQAYSGVFHLLPLGVRVQEKIERLIEHHMRAVGASKLSLSSISSEALWRRSGRLGGSNSELFHFRDRKDTRLILSPTHEEEITSLIGSIVKSYKDLPVRLYQISRKYRDEPRPRQGLLRTREFVMKDLYTFDLTRDQALETYEEIRDAYASFFDAFKIPYLVAEADSGSMGGNLSHEYHFPASNGEDTIISCSTCQYVANAELAESRQTCPETQATDTVPSHEWTWCREREPGGNVRLSLGPTPEPVAAVEKMDVATWTGVTQDRHTLVIAHYPAMSDLEESTTGSGSKNDINHHAAKAVVDQLATGIEDPVEIWMQALAPCPRAKAGEEHEHARIVRLFDHRVRETAQETSASLAFLKHKIAERGDSFSLDGLLVHDITADPITRKPLNLLQIKSGDPCAKCSTGLLKVQRAVELGHTFFLGTRYSKALHVAVAADSQLKAGKGRNGTGAAALRAEEYPIEESAEEKDHVLLQMGCHGIGISRLVAAVANTLADSKGLNWPRVIAPFEVVVIPSGGLEDAAAYVYDQLVVSSPPTGSPTALDSIGPDKSTMDVALDDREKNMVWKLADADLIGYPIMVVVGKSWRDNQRCEVQCRRLGLRTEVAVDELKRFLLCLLEQL